MTKTKNTLCITFSAAAVALFAITFLATHVLKLDVGANHFQVWEYSTLNDLLLALPFVGLLVFAIMERNNAIANPRWYIVSVVALFVPHLVFSICSGSSMNFSALCCSVLGSMTDFTMAILFTRLILLIHTPRMSKFFLWGYVSFSTFFWGTCLYFLLTDGWHDYDVTVLRWIGLSFAADILFHIALLLFSDCLRDDNKITLDNILPWANEDEDEEEDDEAVRSCDFQKEYQKVLVRILAQGDNDFFLAHNFLTDLAHQRLANENGLYSEETYRRHCDTILSKIHEVNERCPGLLDEDFVGTCEEGFGASHPALLRIYTLFMAQEMIGHTTPGCVNAIHNLLYKDEKENTENGESPKASE